VLEGRLVTLMKHIILVTVVLAATTMVLVGQPARADNLFLTCKSPVVQMDIGHSSYLLNQATAMDFYFSQYKPAATPLQNGQCSLQGRAWQGGDPGCVVADVGQVRVIMRNGVISDVIFPEHPDLNRFVLTAGTIVHFKAHAANSCWLVDW
jgi:hypothetical protein